MNELETVFRDLNSQLEKTVSTKYPLPDHYEGIKISVDEDKKSRRVILSVGDYRVSLSILGARDLALALRQAANRAERKIQ